MVDKHRSKGKNKSKWSNRRNRFTPKQEQRVDKELLQEVSVLLSINKNIDAKTICKLYHITDRQLDYIKEHQQNWEILTKNKEE